MMMKRKSRWAFFALPTLFIFLILILVGCSEKSGRKGLPLIDDFTQAPSAANSEPTPNEEGPTPPTRPTDEIFVQRDFCACINGRPDILKNCAAFCARRPKANADLYGRVTVGPSIALNESLRNLHGWCTAEFEGSAASSCSIKAEYEGTAILFDLKTQEDSNRFTANLSLLDYDKTYVATIVAKDSVSKAYSTSFHLRRIKQKKTYPQGPLKLAPISQYTCIIKGGRIDTNTGEFYSDKQIRFYYYFPNDEAPSPIPPGTPNLFCHDIKTYRDDDDPRFPRLELRPNHITLWDKTDSLLFAQNRDNKLDINKVLEERLLDEFNIRRTINLFIPFKWASWPKRSESDEDERPEGFTPTIGHHMQYFVDKNDKAFCPKQYHYNSSDPLFKLLKEYIGVDTEGIYYAIREPLFIEEKNDYENNSLNILVIREGTLRKIWFYYNDRKRYIPNDIAASRETIRFFWPPDEEYPRTKKPHQKTYTIRDPQFIASLNNPREPTAPPASDKRFGCIPKEKKSR